MPDRNPSDHSLVSESFLVLNHTNPRLAKILEQMIDVTSMTQKGQFFPLGKDVIFPIEDIEIYGRQIAHPFTERELQVLDLAS